MPQVGLEPAIAVFERLKKVHALGEFHMRKKGINQIFVPHLQNLQTLRRTQPYNFTPTAAEHRTQT
jgi:hypothetical protein